MRQASGMDPFGFVSCFCLVFLTPPSKLKWNQPICFFGWLFVGGPYIRIWTYTLYIYIYFFFMCFFNVYMMNQDDNSSDKLISTDLFSQNRYGALASGFYSV